MSNDISTQQNEAHEKEMLPVMPEPVAMGLDEWPPANELNALSPLYTRTCTV